MLKKTIKYTNFFDEEVSEDFYFNYTKAELMDKQYSVNGGFTNMLTMLLGSRDENTMYDVVKKLILGSYGVVSSNGRDFIKTEEQTAAFSHSEAYSNLFMEIINSSDAALAFLVGILPKDVAKDINVNDVKAAMDEASKTGKPVTMLPVKSK